MAGIRQNFTTVIKDDAGRTQATEDSIMIGDSEEEFSVTCPGSGNVSVPLSIVIANVTAFWIVSDKALTMTVNDDGSPDLTVSLAAGVPYWWYTGKGDNPIPNDLTGASALKFAKGTAGDATVKGAFLST